MPISEAGQIYKIYVNDSVLILRGEHSVIQRGQMLPDALQMRYYGKVKALHNVIDTLEKSPTPRQIVLTAPNVTKLFNEFKGLYRNINAAGGIVENKKGQILAIYRRKFWDLPKGKLDPGESFPKAAVREVLEETGLASVKLGDYLTSTYHTFTTRRESHRALKLTKWYRMTTNTAR